MVQVQQPKFLPTLSKSLLDTALYTVMLSYLTMLYAYKGTLHNQYQKTPIRLGVKGPNKLAEYDLPPSLAVSWRNHCNTVVH